MSANEYQRWTRSTAIYPRPDSASALNYVILGLVGEAGELANKFKKTLRDDGGALTDVKRQELFSEAGDVLWYLARLFDELDVDMESAFAYNRQKLEQRKANDTLSGSGDNR